MKAKPLGVNIEDLRADFESVTGTPFQHLYCPILHVDEDVPLMNGHIVPESLGGKSTVVQRSDIDNGFGSFVEAEAGDAVLQGLDANPFDTVARGDPEEMKKLRRFKTRMQFDGTERIIDLSIGMEDGRPKFFPKSGIDFDAAVGELDKPTEFSAQLGIELDARSSILATALRTNHLCWFRKCGYRYVFSVEGLFVAWILREFYERFIEPRFGPNKTQKGSLFSDEVKREVDDFCFQFANLIRPVPRSSLEDLPEGFRNGTLDSGMVMVLWDGEQVYGHISCVKFGDHHIGVVTPYVKDVRGWALLDLAENFELDFTFGMWNAEKRAFEVGPPSGRTLVWPRVGDTSLSTPPLSIRQATELVIRSGRMPRFQ